jgi:hypothetical protein
MPERKPPEPPKPSYAEDTLFSPPNFGLGPAKSRGRRPVMRPTPLALDQRTIVSLSRKPWKRTAMGVGKYKGGRGRGEVVSKKTVVQTL